MQELAFIYLISFVHRFIVFFFQAPNHPQNNMNIQKLSAAAAGLIFSRILAHTMLINSLLYAVVVHEMFPDIVILENFQKRLRNTHG